MNKAALFILTLLSFNLCACHPDLMQQITGGKGGHGVIVVNPYYNSHGITNGMVYIRYAASTPPISGSYDDSVQCIFSAATFTQLQTGDYYLFAKGYDTTNAATLLQGGNAAKLINSDTIKLNLRTSPI